MFSRNKYIEEEEEKKKKDCKLSNQETMKEGRWTKIPQTGSLEHCQSKLPLIYLFFFKHNLKGEAWEWKHIIITAIIITILYNSCSVRRVYYMVCKTGQHI